MSQERLHQRVISVMLSGGFEVSERFTMRPRSFDLIASDGQITLVIKVVSHIDSISEEVAHDLDAIARHLKGSPLIIGERARDADLERGAVYIRYGIFATSIATLHDYVVEGVPPLVYASPGGLYVTINGEALRDLRERRNLSLGDLGQYLGVSRRTISKYEGGMGTTLDIALKIEEIFDHGLVQPIDLLKRWSGEIPEEEHSGETPMAFLEEIGLTLHMLRRAPFQALITFREETILTGYGPVQKVAKRAALIGNISQVTGMRAMCILTDYYKKKRVGKTLLIGEERLHRLRNGAELIDLIDS
ncbi:MAG: transcriptional regulator [Methanoregulaceae archaeon]|nr:transcriptional regulator [Methanoregulaceae archaeon]